MCERQTERGTGRTKRQMLEAPREAVFVWVNSHLGYPRELARSLGREDLEIVRPSWLLSSKWRGRKLSGVVLDHALILDRDERIAFDQIKSRIHPGLPA